MGETKTPSRIGVCSWSLQPNSAQELVEALHELNITKCQLALVPLVDDPATWSGAVETLRDADIEIASGMLAMIGEDYSTLETIRETGGVTSDEHWPANQERATKVAALAAEHDIPLVTFHAGFIPEEMDSPEYATIIERLNTVSDIFEQHDIDLAFETGQEYCDTLLATLAELDRSNVGVNFDPANMILYGMGDPVEALSTLSPFVRQVHVKDALPVEDDAADLEGQVGGWGSEVVVGTGAIDWPAFFAIVQQIPEHIDLIIEREAGESRLADIAVARDVIIKHLGG